MSLWYCVIVLLCHCVREVPKKNILMDLIQPHPKPPPLALYQLWHISNHGGEIMNGGFSKSKKMGTLDFGGMFFFWNFP